MKNYLKQNFDLDRAITLFLFFPLGMIISYIFLDINMSMALKDYGDFLAAITALIAVAITVYLDRRNKSKKSSALKRICENELKGYNHQLVDFFLFFREQNGIFLQKSEWPLLKQRFPQSPDIYKNYDLLSELDIKFINAISGLTATHFKIKEMIQTVDSLLATQNSLSSEQVIKILRDMKYLEEKYMLCYNKVSTESKYNLPSDSILRFFQND